MLLDLTFAYLLLTGFFPQPPLSTAAATAVAAASGSERPAADGFAVALRSRWQSGWHLRLVDVVDDGAEVEFELTMALGRQAERFVLSFDRSGSHALAFERALIAAPADGRVYRFESELRDLLQHGSITSLQGECGRFFAEGASGGVAVDPYDYYDVVLQLRGAAAAERWAGIVADDLEAGMKLAGLMPSADLPRRAVSAVDLLLYDGGEEVVHLGLDRRGHVVALEVRWSPVAYASWQRTYGKESALARSLRRSGTARSLVFDAGRHGREPRLEITFAGGAKLAIDAADFALDDETAYDDDDACPC